MTALAYYIGFILLLWCGVTLATPSIHLNLEHLRYGPLFGAEADVHFDAKSYELTVGRLRLPFSPWQVQQLRLSCRDLQIHSLECHQGRLTGFLPRLQQSFAASYRFHLQPDQGKLTLNPLRFAGAAWQLALQWQRQSWQAQVKTRDQPLAASWLRPLLSPYLSWIEDISGHIRLNASATSSLKAMRLELDLQGREVNFHDTDYGRATERLGFTFNLQAKHTGQFWRGTLAAGIDHGEALYLPVYLSLANHPVSLQGHFLWAIWDQWLQLTDVRVRQSDVFELAGNFKLDNGIISGANAAFRANLPALFQWYIHSFLEGGNWEGLELSHGTARGHVEIRANQPQQGRLEMDGIILSDREKRLGIRHLAARLYWQRRLTARHRPFPTSWIGWHAGHLYAIPFGRAELLLRLVDDDLRMLHPVSIPVLDGHLRITQLELLNLTTVPKVHFAGMIEAISLEPLTRVLGLPPLAGNLSGTIPRVTYDDHQRTLKLDGRLTIQVFDGEVIIENLVIADLFGPLPRLQANVFFHNLDLELVTRHFAFGRITGRLTGYIKDLYLEDWHPVSFDAWFGTPTDDRSRKRISQKAVENLADLGGRGAASLLSRTFLRVFEEFTYDRIGLGCHLIRNVCELRGVAPAPKGFYIVKGGGLPRIDVIGYNGRIDWPTLLARLVRITQINQPVIQP